MRERDIPAHLHDRYGIRPRPAWFPAAVAVVVVAVLAFGGWVGSRFLASKNPPFALQTWELVDPTHVELQLQVSASTAPRWCAIRAVDFDHFDVGFVILPLQPSATTTDVTYTMTVLDRPTAVDVIDCNPDPLELAGAQFRPGIAPPAQPAPGRIPGLWQ